LCGADGEDGAQGNIGLSGPAGEPGPAGERGARGETGPPGPVGKDGKDGKDGKLPMIKSWREAVYYAGDCVFHLGGTYQAKTDTGHAPPHADWMPIALPGADGKSFHVRGTYEPGTQFPTYQELDIVVLNGASFIARQDNPGPCPGEGWQMIARQGQRGVAGERGERGPSGDAGAPGAAALMIRSWRIDRKKFIAVPIMSDGKDGPPLELRSFFEQFNDETS